MRWSIKTYLLMICLMLICNQCENKYLTQLFHHSSEDVVQVKKGTPVETVYFSKTTFARARNLHTAP